MHHSNQTEISNSVSKIKLIYLNSMKKENKYMWYLNFLNAILPAIVVLLNIYVVIFCGSPSNLKSCVCFFVTSLVNCFTVLYKMSSINSNSQKLVTHFNNSNSIRNGNNAGLLDNPFKSAFSELRLTGSILYTICFFQVLILQSELSFLRNVFLIKKIVHICSFSYLNATMGVIFLEKDFFLKVWCLLFVTFIIILAVSPCFIFNEKIEYPVIFLYFGLLYVAYCLFMVLQHWIEMCIKEQEKQYQKKNFKQNTNEVVKYFKYFFILLMVVYVISILDMSWFLYNNFIYVSNSCNSEFSIY